MHRGKIIGAIVLVVAIGLIVAQRTSDQDEITTTGADAPAAAVSSMAALAAWPTGVSDSYTVDAAQTEVYWRIYRAGAMASLGHNHVISVGQLEGSVSTGDDPSTAQWDLVIPVNGLTIDDPEIRARYGEDFESVPSEEDKAGTKENMLTEDLLNGAVYPAISLTGRGVLGTLETASLPVTIELAGNSIETAFPASVSIDGNSVTIEGEVRMTHEDLGLVPFSIFGGAMAVGDDIDFSYRIRAVAGGQ